MKTKNTFLVLALFLATFVTGAKPNQTDKLSKYTLATDVVYGKGKVTVDGEIRDKDLWMDVYSPAERVDEALPAVVLTHGGSFHRGNPREAYYEHGGRTTSMREYAMLLAEEGYVVFTISYRLGTDVPVPSFEGYSAEDLNALSWSSPIAMEQSNKIRTAVGLEPVTKENAYLVRNAALAAAEDLRMALDFIKEHHSTFNVDAQNIALGGFSAGGVTSLNVAYALKQDVAAVFTLSGTLSVFCTNLLTDATDMPPLLMFQAQNDLPFISLGQKQFVKQLQEIGFDYELSWVPSFGHFYPAGAVSLGNDTSIMSVEERVIEFLNDNLRKAK